MRVFLCADPDPDRLTTARLLLLIVCRRQKLRAGPTLVYQVHLLHELLLLREFTITSIHVTVIIVL